MLTWQLDRLLRSGPLCAVATFAVPAMMAIVVAAVSDVDNVLGIVLLAAGIMGLGAVFGSAVATAMGALLFGVGTVVAELSPWLMLALACWLFATLVLQDLAGSFHRGPEVNPAVWTMAAGVVAAVAGGSAVAFAVSYGIATLATWRSIVVPFGIGAIGLAAKLAADAHAANTRQLTTKRPRDDRADDSADPR